MRAWKSVLIRKIENEAKFMEGPSLFVLYNLLVYFAECIQDSGQGIKVPYYSPIEIRNLL